MVGKSGSRAPLNIGRHSVAAQGNALDGVSTLPQRLHQIVAGAVGKAEIADEQITSLKVNPDGKVLELTDKELFDYPFIYIVEPGRLTFTEQEIPILRQYLLNGGFLMVDDFWGEEEWANFHQELRLVFPDRESIDLPIEHPIFHCVFDLKEKPQVPGLPHVLSPRWDGRTWEREDAKEVHYRAILDDKGRIMVLICQNTDLGDGWEREGESEVYFREFSEKKAYPMGINIVFYAMTH